MRIDKFLSNLKYGSRKEIKDFLKDEEVVVNENRILDPTFDVNPLVEDIYLLILTTDGELAHHIMHPKTHMEKTYEVTLDREFKSAKTLLKGVTIKDGKDHEYLAKAISIETDQLKVTIVIDEGKFHQVKRMFIAVGYEVLNLKRTKIGKLSIGDLAEGHYRSFERNELI